MNSTTPEEWFVDMFEAEVRSRLSNVPGFTFSREKRSARFDIKKTSANGFDIGAKCETWGLYPEPWGKVAWEPMSNWEPETVIADYLGYVRMPLSPEARLRIVRRRGKIKYESIDFVSTAGWQPYEDWNHLILPFGPITEEIFQNDVFPSRAPFTGLKRNSLQICEWPNNS